MAQRVRKAVFPVAGPHNFGGPENRYGAPRAGHIHEGQDILTAVAVKRICSVIINNG